MTRHNEWWDLKEVVLFLCVCFGQVQAPYPQNSTLKEAFSTVVCSRTLLCNNALMSLGSHEDSLPSHEIPFSSKDYIKITAIALCCCTSIVQLNLVELLFVKVRIYESSANSRNIINMSSHKTDAFWLYKTIIHYSGLFLHARLTVCSRKGVWKREWKWYPKLTLCRAGPGLAWCSLVG